MSSQDYNESRDGVNSSSPSISDEEDEYSSSSSVSEQSAVDEGEPSPSLVVRLDVPPGLRSVVTTILATPSQTMAPGYRNSNPSRRQHRGLVDHDIFEGLPVRNWRRDAVTVAPPPVHEAFTTVKDKWDVELPWGMPKDAHLMPQHSQDLLRAARSGRIYQKRALVEEEDLEVDPLLAEKPEKKEGEPKEEGFVVKTWKLVPKHLEGPEIEYLAKRRKGLRGAAVKGVPVQGQTMTKMTLRRTDEQGNTYVEDVVVPEGQAVEGEVISKTVIADPAAAGAAVEGVAVPQPVKRRPPPPKRKAKGPGRGRRKKMPLAPTSAPAVGGAAPVDGSAPEAPKQEPAVDANGVQIEPEAGAATATEDTEMGDDSNLHSDDDGEGDDGEDGGSDDDDQDGEGEGEGSQTHDQDQDQDDDRMVLDNLPPEPTIAPPKPAISGDFPVETPHGEFGGHSNGHGAAMGGSPLKHAFTPQSYSPDLSTDGGVLGAEGEGEGHAIGQDGHEFEHQPFHEQDQHQYEQHHETQNDSATAEGDEQTPSAFDVNATDFAGMLSGTPPNFGQHESEDMLLDSAQGENGGDEHDLEHQLPDLSDFDPHATGEGDAEDVQQVGEGGEEKFEDLLGSLEDHLNEGGEEPGMDLGEEVGEQGVAGDEEGQGGDVSAALGEEGVTPAEAVAAAVDAAPAVEVEEQDVGAGDAGEVAMIEEQPVDVAAEPEKADEDVVAEQETAVPDADVAAAVSEAVGKEVVPETTVEDAVPEAPVVATEAELAAVDEDVDVEAPVEEVAVVAEAPQVVTQEEAPEAAPAQEETQQETATEAAKGEEEAAPAEPSTAA